jgi:hypothetical protein
LLLLGSQDGLDRLALDVDGLFFFVKHFVRLAVLTLEHTLEFCYVLIVAIGRVIGPDRSSGTVDRSVRWLLDRWLAIAVICFTLINLKKKCFQGLAMIITSVD